MLKKDKNLMAKDNKIDLTDKKYEFQNDLSLIDYNLSLSYEDRLLLHQKALDSVNELIRARKQLYGES
jgi:hypothetical protein